MVHWNSNKKLSFVQSALLSRRMRRAFRAHVSTASHRLSKGANDAVEQPANMIWLRVLFFSYAQNSPEHDVLPTSKTCLLWQVVFD